MRRGNLVTVAAKGDYGKPRPAVVVQSDWLSDTESVLVCLMTHVLRDAPLFRLTVHPSADNGLREVTQIMADKVMAVRRDKCGQVIGRLDEETMAVLTRMLGLIMGIAG